MTNTMNQVNRPADGQGTDEFVVRPLLEADWPAAKVVDGLAFGYQPDDDFLDTVALPTYDLRRFTGVFDAGIDGQLAGLGAIQSRDMTLPGQRPTAVAAVTWVGVRPDHQRRGILRRVMTDQLHGLHAAVGEPVAILTASEGGIYGRFGYGNAEPRLRLVVAAPAEFRPGTQIQRVRQVDRNEAMSAAKVHYRTAQSATTGFLSRSDSDWAARFSEHPKVARDRSPLRYVLHADGYAVYHLTQGRSKAGPDHTLEVEEICATSPLGWASIWNFLLHHPLVRTVKYRMAWSDDPLQDLLADPRAMIKEHTDQVWVRLVDLQRALPLRNYSASAAVVVRVTDEFCPWNAGVWRLDLDRNGGTATPSTDPASAELDIADLGAAFLGGSRIARLAAAGRVTGSPDAVSALDCAMATPLRPWTPEGF